MVSALRICQSRILCGAEHHVLSVADQAVCRRVQKLRFTAVVEASDVGDNLRDCRRVLGRHVKLTLGILRHEGVNVVNVPYGSVPAVSDKELSVDLVRLQVADVQDPDTVSLPGKGKG
jgi:hypothetical protein